MCQALSLRFGWSDTRVPASARHLCVDQLAAVLPDGPDADSTCGTAGLVISELMSNAIKVGDGSVGLTFTVHRDHVRIAVTDESPELPKLRTARTTDTSGRGLAIVQALSSSWGVEVAPPGKTVWALVPLPHDITAAVDCRLGGLEQEDDFVPTFVDEGLVALDDLRFRPLEAYESDNARLASDEVLVDMLGRVRDLLRADTAAVLLRDGNSDQLVARAAVGLEEEVRQGFRLEIGRGFAGGIAANGSARVLDHVDASTVANPILWQKGLRTMLGVPLVGAAGVLGVLHVGRLTRRHFTAADSTLLDAAAARIVTALQSRQLVVERAAASLLERSLLPTRMPQLPGIELAARYAATESHLVGGDWYDAFVLPSGKLCLIIGDVAGHGLNAAVIMGRLKSAVRAYALTTDSPERMLELADRKMQHFEFGTMVTALCAVAAPPFERFTICSAGHLPPVLAAPGRTAELAALPTGPPLGVRPEIRRSCGTVDVPVGGVLVCYTDGLVERRAESLTDRIDELRRTVPAVGAEAVCNAVMNTMVGGTAAGDDIALLVAHRTDSQVCGQGGS